jgi:hypothetical protein
MSDSKKLIKSVEELPKSFCLEKYAGTADLDAAGWAQALLVRERLQRRYKHSILVSGVVNDQFIYTLFKDPLFQRKPSPIQINRLEIGEPPLRHLTVSDLHELIHYLNAYPEAKEVDRRYANLWSNKTTEPLSESAGSFASAHVDSIYSSNKIYLSVDMTCSDDQLIDKFKSMLSKYRSSQNIKLRKSEYNETQFKKWHDLAILPYLDLSLWAKANGVSIKPSLLSKAIYKDSDLYFDNSRTITDTVKPMAKKLMQREALETLYVQAQEDLRRQMERKKPRLFF